MPIIDPRPIPIIPEHTIGAVGTASPGTSVTTGASSNTKGTAVELIASTARDSYWITVMAVGYGSNTVSSAGCLDILIGAATESVLIPNLLIGGAGGIAAQEKGIKTWDFPLYIPSGSRIAAQAAGERTSTAFRVAVKLYGGGLGDPPWKYGTKVTTYGVSAAPSGTAITAGASGAEGNWTQITASTTEPHIAVVPSLQVAAGDGSWLARPIFVDIGIGAATEQMIAESYIWQTDNVETMCGPSPTFPTYWPIPASTRLTMRASGSGTVDGYEGALHCVS